MNRKNIIRLTESEFKKLISESVRNIVEDFHKSFNYGTNEQNVRFDFDLYDLLSNGFQNQELEEFFSYANAPKTVDVSLTVNVQSYDEGDYDTAPYGSDMAFVDCEVDVDGKFKEFFKKNNMEELYNEFVKEIYSYLQANFENYVDDFMYDDYDPYEYDPDDESYD